MEKKLYRSRSQKIIAGVCGGIAEYFQVDVTLIRLLFALTVIWGGIGIILYILAIIIIPLNPSIDSESFEDGSYNSQSSFNKNNAALIVGIALIAIGGISLIKRIFPIGWDFVREFGWPAILIVIGGVVIYSAIKKK